MKKLLVLIVVSVVFGISCTAPKESLGQTALQKIRMSYSSISPAMKIALDEKRNPPVTAPSLDMRNRDEADPWQMKNIGDHLAISLVRNVDSWDIDFTTLGISDADIEKFNIKAYYYEDNKVSYENYKVFVDLVSAANYEWSLFAKPNNTTLAAIQPSTTNVYASNYLFATYPDINWSLPINRSSVVLIYTPWAGEADWNFKYYLKGLNYGSGDMEIVGYEVYKYEPLENVGDTDHSTPYVPTYIGSPAIL